MKGARGPPVPCHLCPCQSFLPSQERPLHPKQDSSHTCWDQRLGRGSMQAPGRSWKDGCQSPQLSCTPEPGSSSAQVSSHLLTPHKPCLLQPLSCPLRLQGPFPSEAGPGSLPPSGLLYLRSLLSPLLLGKFSNLEQSCTNHAMSPPLSFI